jgi:hypothetical protein
MQPFRLGFTPFVEHQVLATVCDSYRDLFPKGRIQPENGDITRERMNGFWKCRKDKE